MSTTNLFVELIVIGVSASAWLALLLLTAFGWRWIPVQPVLSPTALVPLLAVTYLLGIITDRVADSIFERLWTERVRSPEFANRDEYHEARHEVLLGSERLAELIEYGRSRLRICRGWALNGVLLAIAIALFAWRRIPDPAVAWRVALFGTGASLAVAAGAWFSWRKLSATEYRKLREQAAMLRRRSMQAGQEEAPARLFVQRDGDAGPNVSPGRPPHPLPTSAPEP